MVDLTPKEYNELKESGYNDEQIKEALGEFNVTNALPEEDINDMGQLSSFQYAPTENLIKWQLELNDILERAEHILRGDVVAVKNGNVIWEKNINPKDNTLNEYGVQKIMQILSSYVNRNTILSDYTPKEINEKVLDFGIELNNLFFMKYDDMGLTNLEKRKNYPMLFTEVKDIVHSAYKRAQYGKERDSLRSARQILQQEQITSQMPNINVNAGQPLKQRGLLNPMRYVTGRYA